MMIHKVGSTPDNGNGTSNDVDINGDCDKDQTIKMKT